MFVGLVAAFRVSLFWNLTDGDLTMMTQCCGRGLDHQPELSVVGLWAGSQLTVRRALFPGWKRNLEPRV